MKKDAKRLIKDAEAAGWVFAGVNSKSGERYEHPSRPPFVIGQGADEHTVRQIRVAIGLDVKGPKRSAVAVQERQARDRQRQQQEAARHQAQLQRLRVEKDHLLAGHGAHLTSSEVVALQQQIEQAERELRRYERLMTEAPAAGSHCGTARPARHRAGAA